MSSSYMLQKRCHAELTGSSGLDGGHWGNRLEEDGLTRSQLHEGILVDCRNRRDLGISGGRLMVGQENDRIPMPGTWIAPRTSGSETMSSEPVIGSEVPLSRTPMRSYSLVSMNGWVRNATMMSGEKKRS